MPARSSKESAKAGLAPGTLVHIGEPRSEKVKITVFDYNASSFDEREASVEDCAALAKKETVTWINVDGIHNVGLVEKLGRLFDLHPLTLEDIVSTRQRPKMEDFDAYCYLVLRMPYFERRGGRIRAEQISIVLMKNAVLSFQEREGDVFDSIRDRIRHDKGRVRKCGADYLAYALMDAIVDNGFAILETLGERIEGLENRVLGKPEPPVVKDIHALKRELILLRKAIWPLREVLANLSRDESPLISKSTALYLRDVHDHTIQVVDAIETLRDMVSGMLDVYLSVVSNRMNEVMRVLTVIATIFIPLTFLAGIWGMNFKHMPELDWRWAYPAVLAVMVVIALVMVAYFKRKKWL